MRHVNCELNGLRDAGEFAYRGITTDADPTDSLESLSPAEQAKNIWTWSGYDGIHDDSCEEWWFHNPSGKWSKNERARETE
ncbi:MAG: sarcosine oxidase subunit delta [Alphaproteobacteria bacterium]|nr:sarcosine oxidase subunit delta [Alphaproteobacteria bacterium]